MTAAHTQTHSPSCLVMFYFHQINRANSHSANNNDNTINTVCLEFYYYCIIIIIIISVITMTMSTTIIYLNYGLSNLC